MTKPHVNTNCVANGYASPNETIIEISSDAGGCLISLRIMATPNSDHPGTLIVDVHHTDPSVRVLSPDHPTYTPDR